MHQGSILSPFIAAVVDVTKLAREHALSELMYADVLVLMSETTDGLRNRFLKWMVAFEINGLKVSLWKT